MHIDKLIVIEQVIMETWRSVIIGFFLFFFLFIFFLEYDAVKRINGNSSN